MNSNKSDFFRKIPILLIFLSLITNFTVGFAQKAIVHVLTYNIRLLTPADAPNTWANRKENVFSAIRKVSPGVFGLQEAVYEQVIDMEKAFPGFTRIGVGRDDGIEAGEFSPIFFDKYQYSMIASGTFWLSQTPSVAGSRGWDAACNRVVTWAKLNDQKSGIGFLVFCTHFDHLGEIARRNSARLILHAVDSLAGGIPVIVFGDFNATPGSEPFKIITDKSDPLHLTDARSLSKKNEGPEYTFTGFKVGGQPGARIDYIFIKNSIKVKSFKVNGIINGEYYPSDHLPVNAVLKIN